MNKPPRESIVVTIGYRDSLVTVQHNGAILWKSKFGFGVVDWVIAMLDHVRTTQGLQVGRYTAEKIILCGDFLATSDADGEFLASGRVLASGEPQSIVLSTMIIANIMRARIHFLVDSLAQVLRRPPYEDAVPMGAKAQLPDEFLPMLDTHGIVLDGEYARIRGLDTVIQEALKLRVYVDRDAPPDLV